MIKIKYPSFQFKIKDKEGNEIIFDALRKKWITLTPEEWVRQNFIQYLLQEAKYPPSLIAIEKEIMLGELKKRFDVLIYNRNHQPWMMIECKSMEVSLDQKVLDQVMRYNISVPVQYMVITNGEYSYAFERREEGLMMLEELPKLSEP